MLAFNAAKTTQGRLYLSLAGLCILVATQFTWAGERPAKGGPLKPDALYHNYCSVCHGDRGDGNSRARNSLVPPPRDFTRANELTRDNADHRYPWQAGHCDDRMEDSARAAGDRSGRGLHPEDLHAGGT
jgi:mono/diheme cytochrome c family protein